ncbi:carbohydrate porin [Providencia stuartii]|uniref:carbohydrate porin n=1 Tax=Providencia stuartii TaxID=588 RepID=UPI0023E1681C|nr:carbohydrate porin [Providencia stuartii]ELR5144605.1 carbohydrate porin [Providencia stuartii]WER23199.1 carbohydrate porin [Providencia stuartii]WER27319.1 carbohydrate porin [Providencia stuartii]WER31410.1 carbohydrate porin [Providencia stuartii]
MNMKLLAIAISLGLTVPTITLANTNSLSIEQRLALLEQRTLAAEKRAELAEQKAAHLENVLKNNATISQPANDQQIVTKKTSEAPNLIETNSQYGTLKLYGDVEFNTDIASKKGQLTSINTQAGKDKDFGDYDKWGINGRILIGLDGERVLDNKNYAGFSVQPLAKIDGDVSLDDAEFHFGKKESWQIKLGRYEAYDMFPLNQDTFVEYSGNTANDTYSDGFGYIYMMKEGRGRTNSGGSMMFNTKYDNWYFETNLLIEDGTSIFSNSEYHGRKLINKKNVVYVRPVIAWEKDSFKIAAALESNIVNNAYGYEDKNTGQFKDQSKRNGYGLTLGWNNLKNDPTNGLTINWNTAYLDASHETDFTTGANILWRRLQLGYIYAHNDIKSYALNYDNNIDNEVIFGPGKYDIHTLYTSYELPDILDMNNFKIYIGAYYSVIDGKDIEVKNSDKDRYGTRVRFKYLF